MIKLEDGEYYRTRDGRKIGPAESKSTDGSYFEFEGPWGMLHGGDGVYRGDDAGLDIIAEWEDGPVREVTRRAIIPGTYGRIGVGLKYDRGIWIEIIGDETGSLILTAEELRSAAMVLSQIAEVLDDDAEE